MNKVVNVILQLILVLVFAGIAFVMQGMDVDGGLSNGQLGILILCLPICWLILRFYRSIWFYFAAIVLLLGCLGGYLSVTMGGNLGEQLGALSLKGYIIILFAFFLLCGATMGCVNEMMSLVFFRKLKLPLAAWVIIALCLDFVLELLFFEQNIGLLLLQVKAGALLAGFVLGLAAKGSSFLIGQVTGMDMDQFCFVDYIAGIEEEEFDPDSYVPPATEARPAVQPGLPSRPAPAVAREKPKSSVLDAKLEALCSSGSKKERGRSQKKKEDASSPPDESLPKSDASAPSKKPSGPVPTSTETHKIVSSVDFG